MKYIIPFLFSTLAHADIYIQRLNSEQTGSGYIVQYVENGEVKCWGMPDVLDPAFIPPTWTTITQAALYYNWPVMIGNAATACLAGPTIHRTVGGPLYTINQYMRVEQLSMVPAGIPCGDPIIRFNFLRAVTYNGQVGFAWCQ